MRIKNLLLALCAKSLVIDFVVTDGKVFQISGDRRFSGMFERYFHSNQHPTRREVGEVEAQKALDSVTEIRLWIEPQKYRVVTESELEAEFAPFPIR